MPRPPPSPVFSLKGVMKPVHSLMYDLNDKEELIYAGTQEGKIHVWDLKSNKERAVYSIGDETCLAIHKVVGDSSWLVTQEKNGKYGLWSEVDGKLSLEKWLTLDYFGFCRSVMTEDGRLMACPCADAKVRLVATDRLVEEAVLDDEPTCKSVGEIMVIKLVNDLVFVAYESGLIKVWSMDNRRCLLSCDVISDCPMALDVGGGVGDTLRGYVGSNSDVIKEFDVHTGEMALTSRRALRLTNPGVSAIRIRRDGKLLVASCWDKRVRLFSCKSLKLLVVLDFHKDVVQDVRFSDRRVTHWACDHLLAAAGVDGRVSLWDLYSSK